GGAVEAGIEQGRGAAEAARGHPHHGGAQHGLHAGQGRQRGAEGGEPVLVGGREQRLGCVLHGYYHHLVVAKKLLKRPVALQRRVAFQKPDAETVIDPHCSQPGGLSARAVCPRQHGAVCGAVLHGAGRGRGGLRRKPLHTASRWLGGGGAGGAGHGVVFLPPAGIR
nr:hypothetical protein [Tanacetum cinerariifolium]